AAPARPGRPSGDLARIRLTDATQPRQKPMGGSRLAPARPSQRDLAARAGDWPPHAGPAAAAGYLARIRLTDATQPRQKPLGGSRLAPVGSPGRWAAPGGWQLDRLLDRQLAGGVADPGQSGR